MKLLATLNGFTQRRTVDFSSLKMILYIILEQLEVLKLSNVEQNSEVDKTVAVLVSEAIRVSRQLQVLLFQLLKLS